MLLSIIRSPRFRATVLRSSKSDLASIKVPMQSLLLRKISGFKNSQNLQNLSQLATFSTLSIKSLNQNFNQSQVRNYAVATASGTGSADFQNTATGSSSTSSNSFSSSSSSQSSTSETSASNSSSSTSNSSSSNLNPPKSNSNVQRTTATANASASPNNLPSSSVNPASGLTLRNNLKSSSSSKSKSKSSFSSYIGPSLFLLLSSFTAAGLAFGTDDQFRDLEHRLNLLFDSLEDSNEIFKDYLHSVGDYLVPPKPAPWLLDFETLKYPPSLPTLVIDLDKVVCKLVYDRHHGWQVVKRPGAELFFSELQHYYEIVVFSDEQFPVAQDILQKWNAPVVGVLHRDFCVRGKKREGTNGHWIKDISKLGRQMNRIIHIEHDPIATKLYPENAIVIKPFNPDTNGNNVQNESSSSNSSEPGSPSGDSSSQQPDAELLDLIEFLKAAMHQDDVRQFIKKYGGDGDVGKRYMLEKKEREEKVNKRRIGGFGGGGRSRDMRTDPSGRRF